VSREYSVNFRGEYQLLNRTTGSKLVISSRIPARRQAADQRSAGFRRDTMSDAELRFPDWQLPLQEVVLEFDRAKLLKEIRRVEALIIQRIQQLPRSADGHVERDAINHALSLLEMIKRDRLGLET
jgi:hypothetical protein